MKWANSENSYGWLNISLHWLSVPLVLTLFAMGLWIDSMTYYDPWYRTVPMWHKALGMILTALILFRLLTRIVQVNPEPLLDKASWLFHLARAIHLLFYLLLLLMFVSGYLISTADGRGLSFFNLFALPAIGTGIENIEDLAGDVHEYSAYLLMALVLLHALAALKHHFIDKDKTLLRMIGQSDRN